LRFEHHKVDCVLHVARDGEKALKLIDDISARAPQVPPIDLVILDMHPAQA
jgi:hypothetical protein